MKATVAPGSRAKSNGAPRSGRGIALVPPGYGTSAAASLRPPRAGVEAVPFRPSVMPVQPRLARAAPTETAQRQSIEKPENNTGLPDFLKSGIESLSGISMDDVDVHYNSPQPAQLNASAYAQGSDIHIAPGQERHLPHEAWHVVQQAQGRVQPTMQMKEGVSVNDDAGLEHEAEVMGQKALANVAQHFPIRPRISDLQRGQVIIADELTPVVQQIGSGLSNHVISPQTPVINLPQNAIATLQTYRAEGAPAITQEEQESMNVAALFMGRTQLNRGEFFHVTNVANMSRLGGIFDDPLLDAALGGQGGAGAALGGTAGAVFNVEAQNMSYATNDVAVAIEYFELHLSRAVLANNANLAPVVLKVKRNTPWDLQPDPAQQNAMMTPHGFRVLGLIYSSDLFTQFRLRG